MIKIENLSASQIVLQFQGYTKRLNPNSVLKLTPEEFSRLVPPQPSIAPFLKITKYNVIGELKEKIEIINPTNNKILLKFVQNEKDIYYKSLTGNSSLIVKQEDFDLIHDMDPRLIVNRGEEHKVFFATINKEKEIVKKEEIIPEMQKITPEVIEREIVAPIRGAFVDAVKSYSKKDKKHAK